MKENTSALEQIFNTKRQRVAELKAAVDLAQFVRGAARSRKRTGRRFKSALENRTKTNIIAEFRRASSSTGFIDREKNVVDMVRSFERGGACAISILTEEDNFGGSIEDLHAARKSTSLPLLRKDFVFEEFQVYESALAGADAILLIASMLGDRELVVLCGLAGELGMDSLVEIHNEAEMERVNKLGCPLIGIHNRDPYTVEASFETSRTLAPPSNQIAVLIAESGNRKADEIAALRTLGFDGFLIGEPLMAAADPAKKLSELIGEQ